MQPHETIVALTAILSIFVFLPWLFVHYVFRRRERPGAGGADPVVTAELVALADKLEKRVNAIETILDSESPGWRKHHP